MKHLLPLALSAALAFGAIGAPAQAQKSEPWFVLAPQRQSNWRVIGEPALAKRIQVVPKQTTTGQRFNIFVVASMASSSYTIGLNRILEVFPREGINAQFTYVNYDRDEAKARAALNEIHKGGYDLVFAMGSEAVSFLYKNDPIDKTPTVSVEAKDPVLLGQMKDYQKGSGTHFAFTSLNAPVALQLSYLKTLKPALKNLAIIYSPKNKSAVDTQVTPLAMVGEQTGLHVLKVAAGWHQVTSELKEQIPLAIAHMRATDPTLHNSLFWIVGSTAIFDQLHVINALAGHVPVLSAVPDLVVAGEDSAALAIGATFENDAYMAAMYGASILKGDARAGDLKVGLVSPPDIAISFLKAKQIGLQIPFEFFEDATQIYDPQGKLVRAHGSAVKASSPPIVKFTSPPSPHH